MEWWNGLDWNGGMEWNGMRKATGVLRRMRIRYHTAIIEVLGLCIDKVVCGAVSLSLGGGMDS